MEIGPDFDVNNYLAKTWRELQPAGQKKYTDMHNKLVESGKTAQSSSSVKHEPNSDEDNNMDDDED